MESFTIIFIAVSLAMDCFAVSLAAGTAATGRKVRLAFILALSFGTFQFFMALIGWAAGTGTMDLLYGYDHWVAFVILAFIGGKMIYEGISGKEEKRVNHYTVFTILGLSIATSMDALGVGLTFAFLEANILISAIIIGIASFVFSLAGVFLGSRLGNLLGKKVEIAGGVILILIGIRILAEHASLL
ncbi:MAG TPA: manganese efflux pump MntP family protein [Methanoregulaceae archaeon]|nr:manganese efflux pump MntP family protein [Methanoregulaceae archaeon]